MSQPIITRAAAIEAGLTTYFTGKSCKNGHQAERNTITGICSECSRQRSRAYARTTQKERRQNLKELLRKNAEARSAIEG